METCVETPFHSQNNQPTNKGEEAINKNQVLYGLNALLHAKIVRQLLLQKKKQF